LCGRKSYATRAKTQRAIRSSRRSCLANRRYSLSSILSPVPRTFSQHTNGRHCSRPLTPPPSPHYSVFLELYLPLLHTTNESAHASFQALTTTLIQTSLFGGSAPSLTAGRTDADASTCRLHIDPHTPLRFPF